MSQVRNNQTTYSTVPAGYTATSTYTPAPGTTASNLGTAYYATGSYAQPATYGSTTYETYNVPQYAVNTVTAQRTVASEIPVESRIEYVPFEKKYVEYEQVEKVYQVPYETEVIEYEEVTRNERIPVERTITDYYAVETQVEYIRREVEETIMVEEPVEKVYERVQYIPVETQIVHYPERDNYVPAKTQTRTEYVGVVNGGYEQQGSRVGGTYVTGGSNVGQTTTTYAYGGNASYPTNYTTGYQTTGYVAPTTTTTTYQTTGYVAPTTTTTTYQTTGATGGYVTGGSGVRSGYVTGGSGVRGNATYVSSGSGVKGASYETSVPRY